MAPISGPIIAHRGASKVAPENTAAAFLAALELGCDMIELDARLSRDRRAVVSHDDHLQAVGHLFKVSELLANELTALDAGAWFGAKFKGEKFLTLHQALDLVAGRCPVNVEVKVEDDALAGAAVDATLRDVAQHQAAAALPTPVLYSTFSSAAFDLLANRAPSAPRARLFGMPAWLGWDPTGWLLDRHRRQLGARFAGLAGAEGVHLHERLVTPDLIGAGRAHSLSLRVYTVNDATRLATLLDWGVDGVFTDDVALGRAAADHRAP